MNFVFCAMPAIETSIDIRKKNINIPLFKRTRFEIAIIYAWIYYSLHFLYMPSTMESASEMLGTRISLHLSDRAT